MEGEALPQGGVASLEVVDQIVVAVFLEPEHELAIQECTKFEVGPVVLGGLGSLQLFSSILLVCIMWEHSTGGL